MNDDEGVATRAQLRRGLRWSALNNVGLKLGGLAVGIVLARLLSPEAFGVYAVAMTIQLILVTVAELGVAAHLVRRGQIEARGPTVATISLLTSLALALAMVALASPLSRLMGAEEATPVVQLMSLTLVCAGLGVVPYAVVQRNFLQSTQLVVDASGLVLSTAVTLVCIDSGAGPMSLAIGRVVGQLLTTTLQFLLTRTRLRLGWDRQVAREALRFGLPVAGANLLSWVILNLGNILVGSSLGPVALGLYVIAFNLSSWPMTAVGQTIRSVALPAFSRYPQGSPELRQALERSASYAWALALPLGGLLLVFAHPLITLLYGESWAASAAILTGLAAFGALRVVVDLLVSFLYAGGASRSVLWVQLAWLAGLAPAVWVGIRLGGLAGAGWAQAVVAALVLLPGYLVAMRRLGVPAATVLRGAIRPLLACMPAGLLGLLVARTTDGRLLTVIVGGLVFAVAYTLPLLPWLRRLGRTGTASAGTEAEPALEDLAVESSGPISAPETRV